MTIYVASPTIVLMPEQTATQWKAYGQGTLLGAFVWGEDCQTLLNKLQDDCLINNQIIRKHNDRFFIEFNDAKVKCSLESFIKTCRVSEERVHYQLVYTDHWSEAVSQNTLLVNVDGFLAPIIQLDHTGEFELVEGKEGLSILLDDEGDKVFHSSISHTFVLDGGYYLLSDLSFINDRDAKDYVIKHYFHEGVYEVYNEYSEQGWLVRITIQKKR
ncbi:hypothetical protein [Bacillus sp. CGMCC 1.16541]|uniref:hypothetical protein n=1 Tax=Bacillus sp. CGMCC 1.16541 TaxID=2185143 RepID=UPI000D73D805|nr:hypothetical protein [Bacillus sp. CGMCC 1.16541]